MKELLQIPVKGWDHAKQLKQSGFPLKRQPPYHTLLMKIPVLVWFLLLMSFSGVFGQQMMVSGTVTSSEDGLPLPGVNILIKGTTTGGVSDIEGNFSISVPGSSTVLVFSFIGFDSQEISVNNRSSLDVVMNLDSKSLEEVIVIGYGTQDKRDVTGAIASISESSITERQPVDVFDAMQGQAAGVQVNTEPRPGGGASIRIRGTSTIQGGVNPLYIVDGAPVDNIEGINPNDIQSMEILKDAASAAIYGSRSANGVVIITTKRGVEGKPKIDVRYNRMYSNLARKLPQATADDRRLYDQKRTAADQIPGLSADSLNIAFNADNDLQSILTRTAIRNQLDFSLSGASDKLNYYSNIGFLDDEGIILNSWAKVIRARTNIDFKASDRFVIGSRMNFSHSSENRINEGSTLLQAMQRPPTFQLYMADGTLAPTLGGRQNPLAHTLLRVNEFKSYDANVFNYVSFSITDDLKITSDFNFRASYGENVFFNPKLLSNNLDQNNGGYKNSFNTYWMQQNYLNYDKKFLNDEHSINAVLGISAEKWVDKDAQIVGNTYVIESVLTSNSIQDKQLQNIYNIESRHTLVGIFGRLAYNYKGKYMFSSNIRRDGSSRFGTDNRWGLFPSASVGWRFTDEVFMGWTNRVLQDGKFRASYGVTGNERVGNYDALQRYSFGSNFYNGVLGIVPVDMLGNSELGWESTKQLNIGLDLTFIDNRVSFVTDYYRKVTDDLLYAAPLPGELGFTSTRVNFGSIQNEGIEFTLNTYPVRNSKFTWNLSANMTFNNDKVLKLYNGIPLTPSGRWYLEEGGRLGNFYGWKNLGVYQYDESNAYTSDWERLEPVFSEGEFSGNYLLNGQPYSGEIKQQRMPGGVSKGGDVIWLNNNGDDIIDDRDRIVLGNAQPKFMAGIFNQLDYKNFSLSFNFYVTWGNTIYNKGRRDGGDFNTTNRTPDKYLIQEAWSKPGDITQVPKVPGTPTMGNMQELNSYFLEDGSFIRLRNVRLSYTMDPVLARKIKLQGLNVYLYGNNLLTWTNYFWYDPEIPMGSPLTMGQDTGRYPRSRQYGVGLNLNF